jgi:sodium pump decarboxylase gamma subunit
MVDNLLLAMQITVIGMGLVFMALLVLWLLMTLLTRLAADRAPRMPENDQDAGDDRARRAAIAAVAVALAREAEAEPRAFPLPPTAFVSAWQAVMRSAQLKQRGPVR